MKAPNTLWMLIAMATMSIGFTACEQADNIQTTEAENKQVDCNITDVTNCCTELANKVKDGIAVQLIETASGSTAVVIAATFTDRRLKITQLSALPVQPGPSPRTVSYTVEVAPSSDANYDNGGNAMFSSLIDLSAYDLNQDQLELIFPMPDGTLDQGAGAARRKIRGLMADEQK